MIRCRYPKEIGYRKYQCPIDTHIIRIVPHSCKTKVCTTCSAQRNQIWNEKLKERFPQVACYHITFTIPEQFRNFFGKEDEDWSRKSDMYPAATKAIEAWAKKNGIETGGLEVLHTFGRAANVNPHIHVVIPAGGVSTNKKGKHEWKELPTPSTDYLSTVWRNELLRIVLSQMKDLRVHTEEIIKGLNGSLPQRLKAIKLVLKKSINTKLPAAEWLHVLQVSWYIGVAKRWSHKNPMSYIARYARRLPIAKSRILEFDSKKGTVVWIYECYKTKKLIKSTMPVFEFMKKLLQHISPKNFRLVRTFGIFSNRKSKKYRPIIEEVCEFTPEEEIPPWNERQEILTGEDPLICSCCGEKMKLVETADLQPDGTLKITKHG